MPRHPRVDFKLSEFSKRNLKVISAAQVIPQRADMISNSVALIMLVFRLRSWHHEVIEYFDFDLFYYVKHPFLN